VQLLTEQPLFWVFLHPPPEQLLASAAETNRPQATITTSMTLLIGLLFLHALFRQKRERLGGVKLD
jgi:hypothetical protein